MTSRGVAVLAVLLAAASAHAQWTAVAPGVEYRRFNDTGIDVHVTRVDLDSDAVRVVATRESERGMRVSEYAKKTKAIAVLNADYFDAKMQPIGLTVGACGVWEGTKDTAREGVVAVGDGKGRIDKQKDVMDPPEEWIEAAVSGWPLLVSECTPLAELPGSDAFTRSPHPRSAAGLSKDGDTLYLVVADGRKEGVPGMTLAQLGSFMATELDVCTAINFDGGGSSAMWVRDKIVNRPSDGSERRVANHLAVVLREYVIACDATIETAAAEKRLAARVEKLAETPAKQPAGMTSSTTPTTPTTPTTTTTGNSNAPPAKNATAPQ